MASVGNHNAAITFLQGFNVFDEGVPQFLHARAGLCADGHHPAARLHIGQIAFVEHRDQLRAIADTLAEHLGLRAEGGFVHNTRVAEQHHDAGFLCLLVAAFNAEFLNGVAGFTDTSGVDEPEQHAAERDRLFHRIARGSGDLAHDRPVLLQQRVKQGALAAVGRADNGHGDALLHRVAVTETVDEIATDGDEFVDERQQIIALGELHVLFTEVEFQFNKRAEVNELLAQRFDLPAVAATQLLQRQGVCGLAAACDQIGHGLGLAQVELAVQEGTQRELAGLRHARTVGDHRREQTLLHVDGTMHSDLNHLLAGV